MDACVLSVRGLAWVVGLTAVGCAMVVMSMAFVNRWIRELEAPDD